MNEVVSILVAEGDAMRVELFNSVYHCPLELYLVLRKLFC